MPKPFDATSKHLIESGPRDWLKLAGLPVPPTDRGISIVDSDLSKVVTTSADKLIRVETALLRYMAHIEFEAGGRADLDGDVLQYNVLAKRRHRLPVFSAVFLLRPEALRGATGRVIDRISDAARLEFVYPLIRVWELPAESILAGGTSTLPLAPIAAVKEADLAAVVGTLRRRLATELPRQEARELLAATELLAGLGKFQDRIKELLMQSVLELKESKTYQAILREGKIEGKAEGKAEGKIEAARDILLNVGTERFGKPNSAVRRHLMAITDADQITVLISKALKASRWEELIDGGSSPPARARRVKPKTRKS